MTEDRTGKLIDIEAQDILATPAAFRLTDGKNTAWFPKALIENNRDGTWTMPEWLAKEKGFI